MRSKIHADYQIKRRFAFILPGVGLDENSKKSTVFLNTVKCYNVIERADS